jgi:hypothetical protein
MNFKLEKLQSETDDLVASRPATFQRLSEMYNESIRRAQHMLRDSENQISLENEYGVAGEEKVLEFANREPDVIPTHGMDEDSITIEVLEDILDERKAALRQVSVDYCRYEKVMIDTSTVINGIDVSHGKVCSPISAQKKTPPVVAPVPGLRKSRNSL